MIRTEPIVTDAKAVDTLANHDNSGIAASSWDLSTTNTYPNGPVTSFGAHQHSSAHFRH